MRVDISEGDSSDLSGYAAVSIAFEVREMFSLVVSDGGLGGIQFALQQLELPYLKDYDAEPGNHPTEWRAHHDTTSWGVLEARSEGSRVGGAVIAWQTPKVDLLEGRADLAVLWDLRVAVGMRGKGVGAALFRKAERWAGARRARYLKVETQNVNVPACRFYASRGCELGAVHRFAYPAFPAEVQLFWYKRLAPSAV